MSKNGLIRCGGNAADGKCTQWVRPENRGNCGKCAGNSRVTVGASEKVESSIDAITRQLMVDDSTPEWGRSTLIGTESVRLGNDAVAGHHPAVITRKSQVEYDMAGLGDNISSRSREVYTKLSETRPLPPYSESKMFEGEVSDRVIVSMQNVSHGRRLTTEDVSGLSEGAEVAQSNNDLLAAIEQTVEENYKLVPKEELRATRWDAALIVGLNGVQPRDKHEKEVKEAMLRLAATGVPSNELVEKSVTETDGLFKKESRLRAAANHIFETGAANGVVAMKKLERERSEFIRTERQHRANKGQAVTWTDEEAQDWADSELRNKLAGRSSTSPKREWISGPDDKGGVAYILARGEVPELRLNHLAPSYSVVSPELVRRSPLAARIAEQSVWDRSRQGGVPMNVPTPLHAKALQVLNGYTQK